MELLSFVQNSILLQPGELMGLCWHLEPLSEIYFIDKKLRESTAASVLMDLYPKCMVFRQTVRYFCSARDSDPNGQRRKALGLLRP